MLKTRRYKYYTLNTMPMNKKPIMPNGCLVSVPVDFRIGI